MKKNFNTIFNSKPFYIIFSIIASIALWSYVTYVENPDIAVTVSGIQVELNGKDALAENGLIVTNVNANTVSMRFSGSRKIVTKLDNTNVTVSVDLSSIVSSASTSNGTGVFQLSYKINYPTTINSSSITASDASYDYITITVEKVEEKSIPVKGTYTGDVAEGYQADTMEFDPDTITVSGPESVVDQVAYAWVNVERDNLSETLQEEMNVVLMDADGKEIKSDYLTLSQSAVLVTLPIVTVKDVALTVTFIDGNSVTAADVSYTVSPETITISGDPEVMKDLNQINLGTIDLKDFAQSTTKTFSIPIPNNVTNVTGKTTATVTVNINGLDTTKLTATNIQVKNVPTGYTADIVTASMDVTIRGTTDAISQVTASNIRIVADLSEIGNSIGTFSVEAVVYVDDVSGVDAVGSYKITVTLTAG